MESPKSELRDGMRIDWTFRSGMDDGLVLRCDIYRPVKEGRYPGHPQLRPVRQGTRVPGRLSSAGSGWSPSTRRRPRLHQQYQNWNRRSEKVGPGGLTPARAWIRAEPGALRAPSTIFPRARPGFLRLHRMGRRARPGFEREGRPERHFLHGSISGTSLRCGRRISPRCASGRARPIGTAT